VRAFPILLLTLAAAAPFADASARALPDAGVFDSRLRVVDYNRDDVVQIIGAYGVVTHLEFAADEKITNTALGDTLAWQVAPVTNHLFIKPIEPNAHTNMTVLTNKRVYQFDLAVGDEIEPAYYGVVFRFPQQELEQRLAAAQAAADALSSAEEAQRAAAARAAEAQQLKQAIQDSDRAVRRNVNYWFKGSTEVLPDTAFDDGQFTYLRYAGNRELPVIYLEDGRGNESLVNTTVRGDTIVVQRLAKRFILRKGEDVALVVNAYYDRNGVSNDTGTVSSAVQRNVIGFEAHSEPDASVVRATAVPTAVSTAAVARPPVSVMAIEPSAPLMVQTTPNRPMALQLSAAAHAPSRNTTGFEDKRELSPARARYLASLAEREVPATKTLQVVLGGNIHRLPSMDSDRIGYVAASTQRIAVGRNDRGNWLSIEFGGPGNETGWISSDLVADHPGLMNLPIQP
jgi:type IV secretion system protein VirB9